MVTNLMPNFEQQSDGRALPNWPDEEDARWLIASFLRSDIGFSLEIASEVSDGLDAVRLRRRESWRWDGNSFTLQVTSNSCSLELCDSNLPAHFRPVSLSLSELGEILDHWKMRISMSIGPQNSRG